MYTQMQIVCISEYVPHSMCELVHVGVSVYMYCRIRGIKDGLFSRLRACKQ